MTALLDTNILIDYLDAVPEAGAEIRRYEGPSISVVTFVEVLVGTPPQFESGTRAFLAGFRVILLGGDIVERSFFDENAASSCRTPSYWRRPTHVPSCW